MHIPSGTLLSVTEMQKQKYMKMYRYWKLLGQECGGEGGVPLGIPIKRLEPPPLELTSGKFCLWVYSLVYEHSPQA